jgi:hypothetical protein
MPGAPDSDPGDTADSAPGDTADSDPGNTGLTGRRRFVTAIGALGVVGLAGCGGGGDGTPTDTDPSTTVTEGPSTTTGPARTPTPAGSTPTRTDTATTIPPDLPPDQLEPVAQATWDMVDLFDVEGGTMLRGFTDVSGDGTADLVCNVGAAADFAAISQDGTVIWRNSVDQTEDKPAYYPKLLPAEGCLVHGSRNTDTVYCLNVSDGSVRWTHDASGELHSLEHSDVGVAVGSKGGNGDVTVLDYADGSTRSGWPVEFQQHEQKLVAGDLDGDGEDEFVLNDTSGTIEVRNRDGSLSFDISSNHTHVDLHFVGDLTPVNEGNELVTVVDDDGSVGGEGDEIVSFDAGGEEVSRYEAAAGGVNVAIGDVQSRFGGREVAFGLEGTEEVGLLNAAMTELWTTSISGSGSGAGQIALADIDGDGQVEILANTGENPDAGFTVLDEHGERIATTEGWGWDFDPMYTKADGAIDSKRFVDVDGDGREEVHASRLGANRTSGREVIRLVELVPENAG